MALTGAMYHKRFCKVCHDSFSFVTVSCLHNKQEEMNTIIHVK